MEHHVHITARRGRTGLKLREVWQYRDLVLLMVQRSFKLSYKQTVLGPAWILLQPLLPSAVYAVVFGVIADIGTGEVPQYLFHLFSSSIWGLFSSCLLSNANALASNAYVFGKVYFPRLVMPVSNTIVCLLRALIHLISPLVLLVWYAARGIVSPLWACWPLLPLLTAELCLMGLGIGLIFSSVTTKYRDISHMVSSGVHLWMYASPVVYPLSRLQEGFLRTALLVNPFTAPMECLRRIFLGSGEVVPASLVWSILFAAGCFVAGVLLFNRAERNFIDRV